MENNAINNSFSPWSSFFGGKKTEETKTEIEEKVGANAVEILNNRKEETETKTSTSSFSILGKVTSSIGSVYSSLFPKAEKPISLFDSWVHVNNNDEESKIISIQSILDENNITEEFVDLLEQIVDASEISTYSSPHKTNRTETLKYLATWLYTFKPALYFIPGARALVFAANIGGVIYLIDASAKREKVDSKGEKNLTADEYTKKAIEQLDDILTKLDLTLTVLECIPATAVTVAMIRTAAMPFGAANFSTKAVLWIKDFIDQHYSKKEEKGVI
ncbi:MAG: hypothetical protein Tsb0021_09690 [Chlamydiales bacterium]